MGQTITEKILARAAGREEARAGDIVEARVDLALANDITAPLAIAEFENAGFDKVFDPAKIALVRRLVPVAADLGCTMAQFALAWCLKNPHVSTVIMGASRVAQVRENLKALEVLPKLDDAVMARVETALAG